MALALLRGSFLSLPSFLVKLGSGFSFSRALPLGTALGVLPVFGLFLGSTLLVGLALRVTSAFHSQYQ